VTRDGYGLGALCVLGTEPRSVVESEIAALKDLAAMVMAQIELQHAFGRIDPLSGLPSRNQFLDDLADLAAERPDESRLAVLIDLARPEQVNDYARVMGLGRIDDLIRDAALGIQRAIGSELKLYHTAATQFAFLAPRGVVQDEYVRYLTEGQRQEQQRSITGMLLTSAIGVTAFVPRATGPQDVLRALYGAVQEARSSPDLVGIYSSVADAAYRRRYRLLRDFGPALLAGDQLRLVFQPRIDLPTGRCIGAEALLRWNHPDLGGRVPRRVRPGHRAFAPCAGHDGLRPGDGPGAGAPVAGGGPRDRDLGQRLGGQPARDGFRHLRPGRPAAPRSRAGAAGIGDHRERDHAGCHPCAAPAG
jgi:predicted signal transduction protein with EAL and GGDEF domain